jgi:hypothetical protein
MAVTELAPGGLTRLSNGGYTCFRDCRRKYKYRYVMNLKRSADEAPALHFGRLFHGVIAEWSILRDISAARSWLLKQPCSEDGYHYALAMLLGYVKRWGDETPPMLCELDFTNPIINPATGRRSMRFEQYGIRDSVALHEDSGIWLWERKTASDIGPGYLEKLWSDSQITGYVAALLDAGIPVQGVVYDVIKKTRIKQKKTESAPEFYERRKQLYQSPEMYHREPVYLSAQQILDWRRDVWQVTQDILACRRSGKWYRNTSRCWDWHRPCEFVPICQSGENPIMIDTHYEPRVKHEEKVAPLPPLPF